MHVLCSLTSGRFGREQMPVPIAAWLITEFFFRFHSFALELAAFLTMWIVFDALIQFVRGLTKKTSSAESR